MQRVIKTVFTNLCDLKLAIDGTIVMSQNLKDSLDAMYDARIPERWQKVIDIHYDTLLEHLRRSKNVSFLPSKQTKNVTSTLVIIIKFCFESFPIPAMRIK
jgi:hypothetical protein